MFNNKQRIKKNIDKNDNKEKKGTKGILKKSYRLFNNGPTLKCDHSLCT